ncbi:MAG: hypothetical protein Q9190_000040 [Brigantiaea leucoxantha]
MEQNPLEGLNRIVEEITNPKGPNSAILSPAASQHNESAEDYELRGFEQQCRFQSPKSPLIDTVKPKLHLAKDSQQTRRLVPGSVTVCENTSQSTTGKANFISRPMSSHDDPALGFTFSKAQPLKPLNFDRRQGQALIQSLSMSKSNDIPQQSPATEGQMQLGEQEYGIQTSSAPNPQSFMESTRAESQISQEGHKLPVSRHISISSAPSSASSLSSEVSEMPPGAQNRQGRDSLDPLKVATIESSSVQKASRNAAKVDFNDVQNGSTAEEVTLVSGSPFQQSLDNAKKDLRGTNAGIDGGSHASPVLPMKVTETLRHPTNMPQFESAQSKSNTDGVGTADPWPPNADRGLTDEELLNTLIARYKQECHFRAQAVEKKTEQQQEIKDLIDVCHELNRQLVESQQKDIAKGNELSRYHELVPRWQYRIRKLNDFIKGLSSDHHRLRDDAKIVENQARSIRVEKTNLEMLLRDTRLSVEQERLKSQNQLNEAKLLAEKHKNAVDMLNLQLKKESISLQIEREKANHLQDELSKIGSSHQRVVNMLSEEGSHLVAKVDQLLEQRLAVSESESDLDSSFGKKGIQKCLELLQRLDHVDTINQGDFQEFGASLSDQINQAIDIVKSLEQSATENAATQVKLASDVDKQLRSLDTAVREDVPLREQITELREIRATLREQLRITELDLAQVRQHAAELEKMEQNYVCQTAKLEAEAHSLRSQVQTLTQDLLSIRQSEQDSLILISQASCYQKEVDALKKVLQNKDQEANELSSRFDCLNNQLTEARSKVVSLEDEKNSVEAKAKLDRDHVERQHRTVLQAEISNVRLEFLSQIQLLRDQSGQDDETMDGQKVLISKLESDVEEAKALTLQHQAAFNELQRKYNESSELADARARDIYTVQAERDAAQRLAQEHSKAMDEMEREKSEMSNHLRSRCENLEKELEGKSQHITQLEHALAIFQNNSKADTDADSCNSDQGPKAQQHSPKTPAVLEDLHNASTCYQKCSSSGVSPKKSSQFLEKNSAGLGKSQESDIAHHSTEQDEGGTIEDSGNLGSHNFGDEALPPSSDEFNCQYIMPPDIQRCVYEDPLSPLLDITDMFPATPDLQARFETPRPLSISQDSKTGKRSPLRSNDSQSRPLSGNDRATEGKTSSTEELPKRSPCAPPLATKTPTQADSYGIQLRSRQRGQLSFSISQTSQQSQRYEIRSGKGKRTATQAGHSSKTSKAPSKKSKLSEEQGRATGEPKRPAVSHAVGRRKATSRISTKKSHKGKSSFHRWIN